MRGFKFNQRHYLNLRTCNRYLTLLLIHLIVFGCFRTTNIREILIVVELNMSLHGICSKFARK